MKNTRIPIVILAVIFAACLAVSLFVFGKPAGNVVNIISGGKILYTFDLSKAEDCVFNVECCGGVNTIEIKDHKIHVREADCPDGICVKTGWIGEQTGAAPIVCLPNRVVIEMEQSAADGRTA